MVKNYSSGGAMAQLVVAFWGKRIECLCSRAALAQETQLLTFVWPEACLHTEAHKVPAMSYQGTLKSCNNQKSQGFLIAEGQTGLQDRLLHAKAIIWKPPQGGSMLRLDLDQSHTMFDKIFAINIIGGTARRVNEGIVKNYRPERGYGFIEC